MPSKPQGDLIREQGEEIAKLVQRMDNLQQDLVRFETTLVESRKHFQEAHTQIIVTVKDVERLRERLDELHSRGWDIRKILLTAIVGVIIAVVGAIVGAALDVNKVFQRTAPIEKSLDKK